MCLLVCAIDAHPDYQLVLAANRDEFYDRPADAMHWWKDQSILAGRDKQAGGSWLALDRRGRLCAVTNIREVPLVQGEASRGEFPVEFVTSDVSAEQFGEGLTNSESRYGAFNLLLWDTSRAHYASNRYNQRSVVAGIHGLSNGEFDAPWPKSLRLRAALKQELVSTTLDTEALFEALADRQRPDDADLPQTGVGLDMERMLAPIFIASEIYGTRASTVIAIEHCGRVNVAEQNYGPNGRKLNREEFSFTLER
jgi:uncharacterized protein with NRDE domain